MTRAHRVALALVACALVALARPAPAPAQDAAAALEAARGATHDAWRAADQVLRDARRAAADARAAHQVLVRRERELASAPWWMPAFLTARELASVRRALHEAGAAVVEAEHRLAGAQAQERVTRRLFMAAVDDRVMHLLGRGGEVATIESELVTLRVLGAREDELEPRAPAPAFLDEATLARLSIVELEALELTFEQLALEAERRRGALERLGARAARRVAGLERRVHDQAAGLQERLAHERGERDRLVAWSLEEAARVEVYRGYMGRLEARRAELERRDRAERLGGERG